MTAEQIPQSSQPPTGEIPQTPYDKAVAEFDRVRVLDNYSPRAIQAAFGALNSALGDRTDLDSLARFNLGLRYATTAEEVATGNHDTDSAQAFRQIAGVYRQLLR